MRNVSGMSRVRHTGDGESLMQGGSFLHSLSANAAMLQMKPSSGVLEPANQQK